MNLTQEYRRVLKNLKPGECFEFDMWLLQLHVPVPLTSDWTPADWLLEGIIGSAYEYMIEEIPYNRRVRFRRLETPTDGDAMAYVSPDRRNYFVKGLDGMWRRKT